MTATAAVMALGLLSFGGATGVAQADTTGLNTFEGFNVGSVNTQDGWSSTGPYDQAVVSSSRFASFGGQSLRISSAVTTGSFGDQTFSRGLAAPAGESTGQPHFDSTFQIGTMLDEVQTGLSLSVSPDNGSGARMSYLRFVDETDGVGVFFVDVTDSGPLGAAAAFNSTKIASLSRTSAHTIRFSIDFISGPANDVVRIFVDGALKTTGTTWEDYYRYDPEAVGNGNQIEPVSKLLFRQGGAAAPDTRDAGFLVDNVTLASSATTNACDFSVGAATMALVADCNTDETIMVPDGYTLDGGGFTITAVDPPVTLANPDAHFVGAVVQNAVGASTSSVKNLTVEASLATRCDAFPDSLAGIRLDGASGSITNNTVTGIQQGTSGDGCQEGNAIEVRNTVGAGTPAVSVTGNTVTSYQKTGVLVKGQVAGIVTGNTIAGYGPVGFIAQNGIQVSFGATAQVTGNSISDNFYTPESYDACGLIIYQAGGVKLGKNTFSGNEKDLCNIGRGGGKFGGV